MKLSPNLVEFFRRLSFNVDCALSDNCLPAIYNLEGINIDARHVLCDGMTRLSTGSHDNNKQSMSSDSQLLYAGMNLQLD